MRTKPNFDSALSGIVVLLKKGNIFCYFFFVRIRYADTAAGKIGTDTGRDDSFCYLSIKGPYISAKVVVPPLIISAIASIVPQ